MKRLTVTFLTGETEFDVHPDRITILEEHGVVEAIDADNYRIHPGCSTSLKELVIALLDLDGSTL